MARLHWLLGVLRIVETGDALQSKLAGIRVRRENVRSLSGRETHPVTVAPAGSNRSGRGGDEGIKAFGVEGYVRWFGDHAGRNEQ